MPRVGAVGVFGSQVPRPRVHSIDQVSQVSGARHDLVLYLSCPQVPRPFGPGAVGAVLSLGVSAGQELVLSGATALGLHPLP